MTPTLMEFAEAIIALNDRLDTAETSQVYWRARCEKAQVLLAKIVRDGLVVLDPHRVVFDGTIGCLTGEECAELERLAALGADAL